MSRRLFITFEGGEACGKSTQIALLVDRLRQAEGRICHLVREPGGTPLGEKIRHLVKHDPAGNGMAPETELLLMNASRAELVRKVIHPALERGEAVVCDRFFDSTVAYQQFGRGLDAQRVDAAIRAAVGGLRPNLTIWLQVSREESRRRQAQRNDGGDRFEAEQAAFFERVEAGYAFLAQSDPDRFRPVDGSGDPVTVHERIWALVREVAG